MNRQQEGQPAAEDRYRDGIFGIWDDDLDELVMSSDMTEWAHLCPAVTAIAIAVLSGRLPSRAIQTGDARSFGRWQVNIYHQRGKEWIALDDLGDEEDEMVGGTYFVDELGPDQARNDRTIAAYRQVAASLDAIEWRPVTRLTPGSVYVQQPPAWASSNLHCWPLAAARGRPQIRRCCHV